ncbi:MAG: response regulator [Elusimicrobia bacterium]|nr:response regulator [Elusimicrobiota bacterium]
MTATKTILVIDDELGYRDMLRMDLSVQGFNVFTAAGGLEALAILAQEEIDLVVTDMKMPKMDGLETVIAIKKNHPGIPIILMTGYAIEDRVQTALQLKATICLKKPFAIEELTTVIQRTLPQ